MEFLRRCYDRLAHSTPERRLARAHLHEARQESPEAYLSLVANYLDLVLTFQGSSRSEDSLTRLDRAEQLFLSLWRHLRYAERLSDFEFMLAGALLETADTRGPIVSREPLVTKLRLLDPRARFVFLAHEFERWSERWVRLVMRMRPDELHVVLSQTRCELCGISWDSLSRNERDCLVAISASFKRCDNLKLNRALCERAQQFPRVLDIKAQWFELRPGLVEVRHRYLPRNEEREALLGNILRATGSTPLQRPRLVDRVINSVHFSRTGKIRVS